MYVTLPCCSFGPITSNAYTSVSDLVLSNGYDTIRYDTIEEINVDSKAEYTA